MDTDQRPLLKCPRCGGTISPDDQTCPHCGVNLGVAAVLAERLVSLVPPVHVPPGDAVAPETLVPRLGERLVSAGLITPRQLDEALDYQRKRAEEGSPIRLGQALVVLGYLDRDTLDRVVTEIILQLQSALYQANARLEQEVAERTKQLQDALLRLSELQRLKANFVANVSHELRTPLTHLVGYLDLMADGTVGDLNAAQKRAVDVMQRAAQRLSRLIEDLISFALLSKGTLSIEMDVVLVDDLIAEVMETIQSSIKAKGLTFRQEVQPGLYVFADRQKIGWVLHQLLDNAVKFTPEGGEIVLRAWKARAKVYFAVEDTGIGIPKERLQVIFEPFVQLEDSATRQYGGAGLGLALVKQVLDAHDTELEIESEPGMGTKVRFALLQTGRSGEAS